MRNKKKRFSQIKNVAQARNAQLSVLEVEHLELLSYKYGFEVRDLTRTYFISQYPFIVLEQKLRGMRDLNVEVALDYYYAYLKNQTQNEEKSKYTYGN